VGDRMCGRRSTAHTAQLVIRVMAINVGEMNPLTGTTNEFSTTRNGSDHS